MSEYNPQWYRRLKATEPFANPRFTRENIYTIEQKAALGRVEPRRGMYRRIVAIVAAACAILFLTTMVLSYMEIQWGRTPIQTQTPEPAENENLHEGWVLSPQQLELYETFTRQPNDALLKGLEPVDIFKWYMRAVLLGDFDVVYALFIQGSEYAVPSREEFLNGVAGDPEGVQRGKVQSKTLEQNYRLEQRMEGDAALIVMTLNGKQNPKDEVAGLGVVLEDQKGFGLTRNKEGVWKVNWMPMQ